MTGIAASVLAAAQTVADEFVTATDGVTVDAAEILTGRAALLGLAAHGRVSAGGATRLLPTADGGWCALTLSRPDDVATVPALVGADDEVDAWPAVEEWLAGQRACDAAERARLLGLPVAVLGETTAAPPRIRALGAPKDGPLAGMLVADLSSMWAGPLCGQLLARAGAIVVKVESRGRPDGTRAGERAFFDWMNGGKLSYAVDFGEYHAIAALLKVADVVIEASRPAALARRGLGPDSVAPRDGRVWLRITGHGAVGPQADWVAFGDDAAVSGGLVGYRDGAPVFTGDAIADPLTGLHAAHAVAASRNRGGGELIEFSMAAVAAGYAAHPDGGETSPVRPSPGPPARALGADNAAVEQLIRERTTATC
ncbi:CoA transferase [Mycobacterium sp. 21AC1]|uniref:CoA transferase n=1 Tax=[Mycobacterium] appelbergii TaxID=2939269 RepID=UPI002938E0C0|nr:CoA transferase [Mycobacterium sp. 21AC1]MDV3128520.1 CoA transferase [Mycobacterium sp. 21AC1]